MTHNHDDDVSLLLLLSLVRLVFAKRLDYHCPAVKERIGALLFPFPNDRPSSPARSSGGGHTTNSKNASKSKAKPFDDDNNDSSNDKQKDNNKNVVLLKIESPAGLQMVPPFFVEATASIQSIRRRVAIATCGGLSEVQLFVEAKKKKKTATTSITTATDRSEGGFGGGGGGEQRHDYHIELRDVDDDNTNCTLASYGITPITPFSGSLPSHSHSHTLLLMTRKPIDVLLLGQGGVGKTTFAKRFLRSGPRRRVYDAPSLCEKFPLTLQSNKGPIHFTLWESTSASQRLWTTSAPYFEKAAGAIVMFDVHSNVTLRGAMDWCKTVKLACGEIPLVVCANKIECMDTDKTIKVQSFARKWVRTRERARHNIEYCCLSAKCSYNLCAPLLSIARRYTGDADLTFTDTDQHGNNKKIDSSAASVPQHVLQLLEQEQLRELFLSDDDDDL